MNPPKKPQKTRSRTPSQGTARKAFTLIELTLSVGITSILMLIIFGILSQAMGTWTAALDESDVSRRANKVLDALAEDLSAFISYQAENAWMEFYKDQATDRFGTYKTSTLYFITSTKDGPEDTESFEGELRAIAWKFKRSNLGTTTEPQDSFILSRAVMDAGNTFAGPLKQEFETTSFETFNETSLRGGFSGFSLPAWKTIDHGSEVNVDQDWVDTPANIFATNILDIKFSFVALDSAEQSMPIQDRDFAVSSEAILLFRGVRGHADLEAARRAFEKAQAKIDEAQAALDEAEVAKAKAESLTEAQVAFDAAEAAFQAAAAATADAKADIDMEVAREAAEAEHVVKRKIYEDAKLLPTAAEAAEQANPAVGNWHFLQMNYHQNAAYITAIRSGTRTPAPSFQREYERYTSRTAPENPAADAVSDLVRRSTALTAARRQLSAIHAAQTRIKFAEAAIPIFEARKLIASAAHHEAYDPYWATKDPQTDAEERAHKLASRAFSRTYSASNQAYRVVGKLEEELTAAKAALNDGADPLDGPTQHPRSTEEYTIIEADPDTIEADIQAAEAEYEAAVQASNTKLEALREAEAEARTARNAAQATRDAISDELVAAISRVANTDNDDTRAAAHAALDARDAAQARLEEEYRYSYWRDGIYGNGAEVYTPTIEEAYSRLVEESELADEQAAAATALAEPAKIIKFAAHAALTAAEKVLEDAQTELEYANNPDYYEPGTEDTQAKIDAEQEKVDEAQREVDELQTAYDEAEAHSDPLETAARHARGNASELGRAKTRVEDDLKERREAVHLAQLELDAKKATHITAQALTEAEAAKIQATELLAEAEAKTEPVRRALAEAEAAALLADPFEVASSFRNHSIQQVDITLRLLTSKGARLVRSIPASDTLAERKRAFDAIVGQHSMTFTRRVNLIGSSLGFK